MRIIITAMQMDDLITLSIHVVILIPHFYMYVYFIDSCCKDDFVLIKRALKNQLIIPEFSKFKEKISDLYWECKSINTGKVGVIIYNYLFLSSPL